MSHSSDNFFFNEPGFIHRIPGRRIISFPQTPSGRALIHFTLMDDELVSLHKSTFGGFVTQEATQDDLIQTSKEFLSWAMTHGVKTITIKCFPEIYSPEESDQSNSALSELGFEVLYKDVSQIIKVVRGKPIGMNTHRRRRVRTCLTKGFNFRKLDPAYLDQAYELFVGSRNNKGYPVTMTLEEFKDSFTSFPDKYLLFGVFDRERMNAACVSIRINERILYCFFIGDDISYRTYSPVSLLIHGIYNFCQREMIELIDLGISTDKGIWNEGLYAFKRSLGSFDSDKLTFQKKL